MWRAPSRTFRVRRAAPDSDRIRQAAVRNTSILVANKTVLAVVGDVAGIPEIAGIAADAGPAVQAANTVRIGEARITKILGATGAGSAASIRATASDVPARTSTVDASSGHARQAWGAHAAARSAGPSALSSRAVQSGGAVHIGRAAGTGFTSAWLAPVFNASESCWTLCAGGAWCSALADAGAAIARATGLPRAVRCAAGDLRQSTPFQIRVFSEVRELRVRNRSWNQRQLRDLRVQQIAGESTIRPDKHRLRIKRGQRRRTTTRRSRAVQVDDRVVGGVTKCDDVFRRADRRGGREILVLTEVVGAEEVEDRGARVGFEVASSAAPTIEAGPRRDTC